VRTRFEISRSLSRTHSSLGKVKPVEHGVGREFQGRFPRPSLALTASTCAWLRWSHQISGGADDASGAVEHHQAVICPERADASYWRPCTPACASTPRIASTQAVHQFLGALLGPQRALHEHVFVRSGATPHRTDSRGPSTERARVPPCRCRYPTT